MKENNDLIYFTYFGDILGTSELYAIHRNIGYRQLNKFYNVVFDIFKPLAESDTSLRIYLFSDSLFITGNNLERVLKALGSVYYRLFKENIFLRGAVVEGLLDFDPRIQLDNLIKQLPTTDVLFRAVKLEKSSKGARLLIEKRLAQRILPSHWYTYELYKENLHNPNLPIGDFRRRIVHNSESQAYEYLWPIENHEWLNHVNIQNLLKENAYFSPKYAMNHLGETRKLFKIAKYWLQINNQL